MTEDSFGRPQHKFVNIFKILSNLCDLKKNKLDHMFSGMSYINNILLQCQKVRHTQKG